MQEESNGKFKFNNIESEKSKDHETELSGLDFNRDVGLLVSSC